MNHDDDLTASHWDDILSPSTHTSYNAASSTYLDPEFNGFQDLSLGDPDNTTTHHDDTEPESSEEDSHQAPSAHHEVQESSYAVDSVTESPNYNHSSAYDTARSELEQMHELKKEERAKQKSKLMDELASNDDFDHQLEQSVMAATPGDNFDSLFNDAKSPIKFDLSADVKSKNGKSKQFKRPRKFSSQKNAKNLKSTPAKENENLGPLGSTDNKSTDNLSMKSANAKEELVKESEAPLYDLSKDAQREQQARTPAAIAAIKAHNGEHDPSKPKNHLEITVGDPMKVGDITNAHIVYRITTKNKNLEPSTFPQQTEPFIVTRRYKDFRWIYHQLQNNHMGRIIPPPPSKQTYIGRFNESFIENRRLSLEKMLSKTSSIPDLSNDPDFIMFLTSEDFANESKERERISGSGASLQNNDMLDNPADTSSANNGFMSSIFSISNKPQEPEEFFDTKKHYIEALESNLQNFYSAIELIINQRIDIVNIIEQITVAIQELTDLEISKKTSDTLAAFNEVQIKLKDNLDRVNLQDHLTLGFTIEEYLRIIGSIKYVFDQRLTIYESYQNNLSDLNKKKTSLTKYKSRNQVDKISQLNFEIDKLQTKTDSFEKRFKTISDTIKQELENFELEKIDDFRNSVEIFIESSIESQKESIELWETFYERQSLSSY
ncbi:Vacuolar protein sorting-associated protein vps5 [Yamadazyma tenuis]|uniref:PX domain-containing protein n=1 Tax=Candida tenuis (strain ATCC 10573 / BCRC 21748 / CBS 615 / JCM 9827 / NBRC 10315 / NRRL Y-1498 / VKM Y-70) TaxID=590646 RepID=G3AZX2_CANTC|nr:uncharacterized protein CANTEDRAFT_129554 [Yamadazyma tenuis ATCC 10573]EGV65262.1 hypothetical protein CANTEDRAFT_129554 [Yamadazyma tenuis ATCC 10573]WEJ95083.1 Vacuolar protein sorting-associated protein vps5 [Yamadazyma tenuis]